MPIHNAPTLSKLIQSGAEGGHEFARILKLLLSAEYVSFRDRLVLANDAAGDYRAVDAILRLEDQAKTPEPWRTVGFQFKFFASPLSARHKRDIAKSFRAAVDALSELDVWILVTPDDFNRHDSAWLDEVAKEVPVHHRERPRVEHWGHTKIFDLLMRHPHIGARYYPDVLSGRIPGRLTIDRVMVDKLRCAWASPDEHGVIRHVNWPEQVIDRIGWITLEGLPQARIRAYEAAYGHLSSMPGCERIDSVPLRVFFDAIWEPTGRSPPPGGEAELRDCARRALESWPGWDRIVATHRGSGLLLPLATFHYWFGRSCDPILDVTFLNRSDTTQVVYSVGVDVLEFFEELGGSAIASGPVPVVASISIPIVQRLGESLSSLSDPIMLPSGAAARIKLRLRSFMGAFPSTFTVSLCISAATSAGTIRSTPVCLCCPALPCEGVTDEEWEGPARCIVESTLPSGA